MHELIVNLHMHTVYSDGTGRHTDIAEQAAKSGLDVIIVTDHNVWTQGFEGYHRSGQQKVLMLVGEEVHDQGRQPQKNHLLVMGAEAEMATYARDPQQLIDSVTQRGGLTFIAHPIDPALPLFNEDDLSWEDWEVDRYTGLELWNGFSEFKNVVDSRFSAIFYAFFPQYLAHGPAAEALAKWNELLAGGKKVVAVGGSDAHSLHKSLGPLHKTIFPYRYHFQTVNTHIFTPTPLTGDLQTDRKMVYQALCRGNCFIGYDLPASTRGFRFTAQTSKGTAFMGDELFLEGSATLQIRLPIETDCRLIKDGTLAKSWHRYQVCTYITNEPGVYRVECTIPFLGKDRGWIYSNPIYLRAPASSAFTPT